MPENKDTYRPAFEAFMNNRAALEDAIISSTTASWSGGSYRLELFADGHYRVLWSGQVGNLYNSPGMLLSIPPLSDEEYDEEGGNTYFDNVIEALREAYDEEPI